MHNYALKVNNLFHESISNQVQIMPINALIYILLCICYLYLGRGLPNLSRYLRKKLYSK